MSSREAESGKAHSQSRLAQLEVASAPLLSYSVGPRKAAQLQPTVQCHRSQSFLGDQLSNLPNITIQNYIQNSKLLQ